MLNTEASREPLGIFEGCVLGIVQGLTEFLPISSTAHMRVVPALIAWRDPGAAVSAVIQIGTVLSLLVYFRRELIDVFWRGGLELLKGNLTNLNARQCAGIAIGTVPIVVVGLLCKDLIVNEFRSLWVIAGSLAFFGILMGIADRCFASRAGSQDAKPIGFKIAILVGVAQTFALIPGASRSGTTMTGAFLLGLNRERAAKFSFLLSIPAVGGAGLYEFWSERDAMISSEWLPGTIAGTLTAAIVGYLAIGGLLRFLRTRSTFAFVVYRVGLAILLVVLLVSGVVDESGASSSAPLQAGPGQ